MTKTPLTQLLGVPIGGTLISQIADHMRTYESMYGSKPDHIKLTVKQYEDLTSELGFGVTTLFGAEIIIIGSGASYEAGRFKTVAEGTYT